MFMKIVVDGYIVDIHKTSRDGNISEDEYNIILSILQNAPRAEAGKCYRLKDDLTWELNDMPTPDPDPELDDSAALEILLGGNA